MFHFHHVRRFSLIPIREVKLGRGRQLGRQSLEIFRLFLGRGLVRTVLVQVLTVPIVHTLRPTAFTVIATAAGITTVTQPTFGRDTITLATITVRYVSHYDVKPGPTQCTSHGPDGITRVRAGV